MFEGFLTKKFSNVLLESIRSIKCGINQYHFYDLSNKQEIDKPAYQKIWFQMTSHDLIDLIQFEWGCVVKA